MKEETLKALVEGAWRMVGRKATKRMARSLMHEWFCKHEGVNPDEDTEGASDEEAEAINRAYLGRHDLKEFLEWVVDTRSREMLEWVGRSIPMKGDVLPEPTQRQNIAIHLICCLQGTKLVWLTEVWSKGRLPKRQEVADKLGFDIKKVSEFYAELAKVTGLDLDERRPKTNVWA